MRRRYVTNRANRASLSRSKYVIVACCAAIAMILGAMSVGASRSEAGPAATSNPVMLNEDTSYTTGSPSQHAAKPSNDALAGLQLLPVNTSKPYTPPIKTNGKSKSSNFNVLLGANPIRLNIAAETSGKGLKIDLSVNGTTTPPIEVSVPEVPVVTSPAAADETGSTDTIPADTTPTGGTGTTDGETTDNTLQLLTTTVPETLQ